MIAYIDSSVLLRVALKQPNQLKEFSKISLGVSSRLLKSECLRSIDRLVSIQKLSEKDRIAASQFLFEAFDYIETIGLTESILERVSEPMGLNLGTLDAIHLLSAISWRSHRKKELVIMTHDLALKHAAQSFGFEVLGA